MMKRSLGFTLTELVIAIAIAGTLLALAVPSLYDFMLVQRLKSTNAQLVTDLMLARSEAVARGTYLRILFKQNSTTTCYTLYTNPPGVGGSQRCDCLLGAGSACNAALTNPSTEVRTVVLPRSSAIQVLTPTEADPAIAFNAVTGGLHATPIDNTAPALTSFSIETSIDSSRMLRTTLGRTGRVTVCASSGKLGFTECGP